MKHNHRIHRTKSLLLLSLVLGLFSLIPATGSAAERTVDKGYFAQLLDGDVRLATVGQRAGLHMTFSSPSDAGDAYDAVHADQPGSGSGGVHLSVQLPWK